MEKENAKEAEGLEMKDFATPEGNRQNRNSAEMPKSPDASDGKSMSGKGIAGVVVAVVEFLVRRIFRLIRRK